MRGSRKDHMATLEMTDAIHTPSWGPSLLLSERRCGAIFSALLSPILVLSGMKYILSTNTSLLSRFWALS